MKTSQLIYIPELTLYFNACLLCCQSPIVVVRLYAYALLRAAPLIVDIRHLFNVLRYAVMIWERGRVSYEFCGGLFVLLQRFSDHRPSAQDENEYQMILEMLVNLHCSNNFENLMCFDPSLRWLFACFPSRLVHVLNERAFASLTKDHCGDFAMLCRCLQLGVGDTPQFGVVMEFWLKSVGRWPLQIQREARTTLAKVPLSAPAAVTVAILDHITQALSQPAPTAEPLLYIVVQFLKSYYLAIQAALDCTPEYAVGS